MFRLVQSESLPLSPQLIDAHFNCKPSPTERSLDPSRIKYLHAKAEAGELVTFQWARAKFQGDTIRMNGQHSSTMLKEAIGNGGLQQDKLMVHLDDYEVDTPEDLAVLFRQFDARKSARSSADVAGAYQGLYPSLQEVPRPIAKLAVEGIAWYEKFVVGVRTALGDDQYVLFENAEHHPFIVWMGLVHSIKTPEMKRPAIAAAMYSTFSVNQDEAKLFWDHVARGGIGFDDAAPATMLDNWFKAAKAQESQAMANLKPANFYQASIYAWNALRDGKPLKEIRYRVDKGLLEPSH
jgi:hypothetical protein